MKFFILVPDGCGDFPLETLGGKTPLEAAHMPCINALAAQGEVGTVKTIPEGCEPGSDAANLAIMGFDPLRYLTGRASLEAVGRGVDMAEGETAYRVNLITLTGTGAFDGLTIHDHSAGDISDAEAAALIADIDKALGGADMRFYPGVSYRNLLISDRLPPGLAFTPPHDALGRPVGAHLPRGTDAEAVIDLLRRGHELLKDHPVNRARVQNGQNPANALWFWGAGRKPSLPAFWDKYGVKGTVISAVDLVKGIALCAGLAAPYVPGATGTLATDYAGKAACAVDAFASGQDFVYLHVEAPDECSHGGDLAGKIASLQYIDEKIARPVLAYLRDCGEPYRVLALPDHYTPVRTRTHDATPVPFVLFDSAKPRPADAGRAFSEPSGAGGLYAASGGQLADYFFKDRDSL